MKHIFFTLILVVFAMDLSASDIDEKKFWDWFVENESMLFEFDKNQDFVMDSISEKLSFYEDGIVFEISAVENGRREFVVSADGISELFSSVETLVSTAPKLDRWEVIAFRQRVEDYADSSLNYAGKEFDPSVLWIYSCVENGYFDLIVYFPGYQDEERNAFIAGAYILLDMALGEYDVTKGIRYIDFQKLPMDPNGVGLKPFSELRELFDEFKSGRLASIKGS